VFAPQINISPFHNELAVWELQNPVKLGARSEAGNVQCTTAGSWTSCVSITVGFIGAVTGSPGNGLVAISQIKMPYPHKAIMIIIHQP
jgi:hypothetical protein